MGWKEKAGSAPVGVVAGTISTLWTWERIISLAGVPEDADAWLNMASVIPTPIAAAAFGAFILFAWARWGDAVADWIRVWRKRPSAEKPAAVSFLIFLFVLALAVPWIGFGFIHVMTFSNAVLLWFRKDISFAEALARSQQPFFGDGG